MNETLDPAPAEGNAAALFRPDGWNRLIRIGAVVPHADVGPESELQAMAADQITIHGSRLYFSAMRANGEMDEKIPHDPVTTFTQPPYLDEAVESLAASPAGSRHSAGFDLPVSGTGPGTAEHQTASDRQSTVVRR